MRQAWGDQEKANNQENISLVTQWHSTILFCNKGEGRSFGVYITSSPCLFSHWCKLQIHIYIRCTLPSHLLDAQFVHHDLTVPSIPVIFSVGIEYMCTILHICHGPTGQAHGEKICHVEKIQISVHETCGES